MSSDQVLASCFSCQICQNMGTSFLVALGGAAGDTQDRKEFRGGFRSDPLER
jgi:hypothetical protein